MDTMTVQIQIPAGMAPYLSDDDPEMVFARNAMMIYPMIKTLTISHGKAAEILGVHKIDLIKFYGSMGIPYFDMTEEELLSDLETAMKAAQQCEKRDD